ncbi:MAG: tetratricopeptide repeat protein [Nitrospirota bacterium]|jgi:tetratricopeptide (TPR) repeat protein
MKKVRFRLWGVFVSLSFIIILAPSLAAAGTCEKWAAKVVSVQGTVEVRQEGQTQWLPVKPDDTYCPGDVIRVGEKSRADLALSNQPIVRLDEGSTLVLGGLKDERTSVVNLIDGALYFFSRVVRNLEVHTAFVNAGVEGTEGLVRVENRSTFILILEGKVLASNDAGSATLTSGQAALTEEGKAPEPKVVVRPWDEVRWAIYYPPLIYYRPADFAGHPEGDWRTQVMESLKAYWAGNIAQAFARIKMVPEDIQDPRFFIYRASLLLTVGRVEEAGKDVQRVLQLAPGNSTATALQSVMAVARNEREKALELARKAVEASPESAVARVALSYAQQANLNLDGALESLKKAVQLEPENALAWARLSELWLSFGKLGNALESAQKAVALNPGLSRTQTVLGFAYLMQVKTGKAAEAFRKAIGLDQGAPLPRLGLGLAMIRDGDLDNGRKQIEIAVSLDPDNALIRSYLGKAYFDEKKEKLAGRQYTMAEDLDPRDPTSYFYAAILKQTTNRPVEALHLMQDAIKKNDNRLVYRSSLLVDQDLAARSAGLARIYSDLGFQQLGLVEGWKSENTDPSNYSAHRFLADVYSALPRQKIARVSELLQSQLMQPLNITPIQPSLGQSNLFILEGAGPGALSFNEFNPLFSRNRIALQVSSIVGENGTMGEEMTISRLYNKTSASVGQFHHETNGFRKNSDVNDDIYTVFLQQELTHKTSVQAEYRYRKLKRGDVALRFFENPFPSQNSGFQPGLRQSDKTSSVRLGFHHAFSPGSDLIGNAMYQHADRAEFNKVDFPAFTIAPFPFREVRERDGDENARGGELQYLYSSKYVKATGGGGHFDIDSGEVRTDDGFNASGPVPIFLGSAFANAGDPTADHADVDIDTRHSNVYLYTYINYPKIVTFTIGVSADFFDSETVTSISGLPDLHEKIDKNQVNPKFGITLNPLPGTTIRGAVFRTLKRLLITDQTLEPTQVAGFNQFFDDANAAEAWRYGGAVDQKFSKDVYGGVEYSLRDLPEIPFFNNVTGKMDSADWHEKLGRAYLYWTPHDWVALRAEYRYEEFDRDVKFTFNVKELKTHSVPLAANFFHPSGLSAGVQATYYNQEGDFETLEAPIGVLTHGEDSFWLFDASLGYRLPKRHGFVTVGAKNLFDKDFKYFDVDFQNPAIQPGRFFFVRATLAI